MVSFFFYEAYCEFGNISVINDTKETREGIGNKLIFNIFFMRMYLLGFFAILLAAGFTALPMPKKSTITFKYQLSTYLQDQVESTDYTSWQPGTTIQCEYIDVKACSIEVDYIYTHLDSRGRRVLNDANAPNHITIGTASLGGPVFFVDLITSINISTVVNSQ